MCSNMLQTTSMDSLKDAPPSEVWDFFVADVLRCDAWSLIYGTKFGYTFQLVQ